MSGVVKGVTGVVNSGAVRESIGDSVKATQEALAAEAEEQDSPPSKTAAESMKVAGTSFLEAAKKIAGGK